MPLVFSGTIRDQLPTVASWRRTTAGAPHLGHGLAVPSATSGLALHAPRFTPAGQNLRQPHWSSAAQRVKQSQAEVELTSRLVAAWSKP